MTRSGRKYKGLFPSKKLRRMVEWESLLERDAILLFEFSPGVVNYQEQPAEILYELEGVIHRYYPDFEVILRSGEILHFEIKPAIKLKEMAMVKKYEAIIEKYECDGGNFSLLLDNRIRVEPRLTNLKRLATAHHNSNDYEVLLKEATKVVCIDPTLTAFTLASIFGLSHVMTLIGRGDICCDLDRDILADDNFVRLPTEVDYDALYF